MVLLGFSLSCASGHPVENDFVPTRVGAEIDLSTLESLPSRWIRSSYFDRAMGYRGSRFRVVSLTRLVEMQSPEEMADAVVLECADAYEGLLTVTDIRRFDLQLAVEIEIAAEFARPDWLRPLLVVVPDEQNPPRQERFLTANIQRLRFVNLKDYYAPIERRLDGSPEAARGFQAFRDNCLFCHALEGVGGSKGIDLPARYALDRPEERNRFRVDFARFHNSENPDKQNMEQFMTPETLNDIARFLALWSGDSNKGGP